MVRVHTLYILLFPLVRVHPLYILLFPRIGIGDYLEYAIQYSQKKPIPMRGNNRTSASGFCISARVASEVE